jgi:hypothetical protein
MSIRHYTDTSYESEGVMENQNVEVEGSPRLMRSEAQAEIGDQSK